MQPNMYECSCAVKCGIIHNVTQAIAYHYFEKGSDYIRMIIKTKLITDVPEAHLLNLETEFQFLMQLVKTSIYSNQLDILINLLQKDRPGEVVNKYLTRFDMQCRK